MTVLLDTHVVLWALNDDRRLGARARELLGARPTAVVVSAASIWEAEIKAALGKLTVAGNLRATLRSSGVKALDITWAHAETAGRLPPNHRDPFDRMLIAQSNVEGLPIMSTDPLIMLYDVETIDPTR